jgi:hypothetical protein
MAGAARSPPLPRDELLGLIIAHDDLHIAELIVTKRRMPAVSNASKRS